MWEIYGEGGGQFTNLKDARDAAKEFSKQGNDYDGYTGEPGDVSIWKDGSVYFTYKNGKVMYDGWSLKKNYYTVINLQTLENEEIVTNQSKLEVNHVYVLGDGRRVKVKRKGRIKEEEKPKKELPDNAYIRPDGYIGLPPTDEEDQDGLDDSNISESFKLKHLKESFKINSKLNPSLFDTKTNELKEDVRVRLIEIADLFVENIQEDEVPLKVYDYWLVGSNAAYNYNKDSDIDVHVIVDIKETGVNPYLLKLLYDYIKSNFNDKYDIMVKGHEVELYLEDINTTAITNGIYSLKQARWIKVPELPKNGEETYNIEDSELYNHIYKQFIELKDEDVEKFLDDLYLLRKESLAVDGEFGEGNLVFKQFRNNGYIKELRDRKYKYKSDELTLEKLEEKMLTKGERQALINDFVNYAYETLLYSQGKSQIEIEIPYTTKGEINSFFLDLEYQFKDRGIDYTIVDEKKYGEFTYYCLHINKLRWFNEREQDDE